MHDKPPSDRLRKALEQINPRHHSAYCRRPGPIDITSVRVRFGMTQEQFAGRFGFPVATLRHWERGDRKPHGAARVLLTIIDYEPSAVLRALRRSASPRQ